MKYKQFGSMMVLLMVLMSMIPFAVAQETSAETTVEAEGEFVAQTEAEDEMVTTLEKEVPKETPYERCVQILSTKHPQVEKARAERACKYGAYLRHLARAGSVDIQNCIMKCRAATRDNTEEMCQKRCAALAQQSGAPIRPVVSQKKDLEAKRQYADVREHYLDVKQKYLEQKADFSEARKAFAECKDAETEACITAKQQLAQHTRAFLLKAADMVLEHLKRVAARIEAAENLDQEEKAELLNGAQLRIQAISEAKATIEAMPADVSLEELKKAGAIIRQAWQATRPVLKTSVGHVMVAKLGNILHRTKQLGTKLEGIRNRLETKGYDVSKLDTLLEDFTEKLDAANQAYLKAREQFVQEKTAENRDTAVKQAHELIVEARTSLKEARELLRQIVVEIRAQNRGQLDVEASTSATTEPATEDVEASSNA